MISYKLYYWPLPFRGNFPRLLMEHASAGYEMSSLEENVELKDRAVADQGIPGMAPPMLHDFAEDVWINQMPAIMLYLAEKHGYLPDDHYTRAVSMKVVCDCNDVLSDLTNANGSQMWTRDTWKQFRSVRLVRWLEIFEELGQRFGLESDSGYLLGTGEPSVADFAVTALLHTLRTCMPELAADISGNAPRIDSLLDRVAATPQLNQFYSDQQNALGDLYCGGQIEASIRDMLEHDDADT